MGFAGAGVNGAGRAEEAGRAEAGRAKGGYGADAKETSSASPSRFLTDFGGVIQDLGEKLRPRRWISEREQRSVDRAVRVIQDLENGILDELQKREQGSPEELFDLRRLGWLSRLTPAEIVQNTDYLYQLRDLIAAHAPEEDFGSVEERFHVYQDLLKQLASPEDTSEKGVKDAKDAKDAADAAVTGASAEAPREQRWEREDRLRMAGNRFRAVWEIRINGVSRAIRAKVTAREQVIQDFLNDAGEAQFDEMYSGIRFSMENGIPADVFSAAADGNAEWRDRAIRHYLSQFDIRKRDQSYVLSSYRELRTSKTGFGYLKYINEVQKNPALARLLDEMGRSLALDEVFREDNEELRKRLREVRGHRVRPMADSLNGIRMDNYIPYVLPEEFVKLTDPDLEPLFDIHYLERALLSFDFNRMTGVFKDVPDYGAGAGKGKGRGPLIICVDTSASMKGRNENLSKAVALMAALRCLENRRPCFLINFSIKTVSLRISPDRKAEALGNLSDFLSKSFHGGTSIDEMIRYSMDIVSREDSFKRADLLCLTDGQLSYSNDTAARIAEIRKAYGVRFFELIFGFSGLGASGVFDAVYEYTMRGIRRFRMGAQESEILYGTPLK
ncbi:VWA domain-containing protein [Succinimonas sp.]|uniref:VWA domain-containing protein n=1 Tax=Succinimonas sp. TaxID=1936151 RepID=UPI0038641E69